MDPSLRKACIKGLSAAVFGFGRAGRAAADFLLDAGAVVTVYDERTVDPAAAATYVTRGVRFVTGSFPPNVGADLLVRSPGLRPDHPALLAAVAAGGRLTSETELFLANTKALIVGVTGSDGKTTTATLTAALLRAAGRRVFVGGNTGTPLLPAAEAMTADDAAVLELSSFQLMTVRRSPHVAVLTNLTPNHLDWHRDMAEYAAAKQNVFLHGAGRLVLPADDAAVLDMAREYTGERVWFSDDPTAFSHACRHCIFERDGALVYRAPAGETAFPGLAAFPLVGAHNRRNLAAALGAVVPDIAPAAFEKALPALSPVPHRMAAVGTVGGVTFVDSSIDTTPSRTIATLTAFDGAPLHILLGGRGKNVSFAPLAAALAERAVRAYLYGEAAGEIEAALQNHVFYTRFATFDAAFLAAARAARPGETVLLSPACTSFDAFCDYEERGAHFAASVRAFRAEREEC